jgi:hypothetical protein
LDFVLFIWATGAISFCVFWLFVVAPAITDYLADFGLIIGKLPPFLRALYAAFVGLVAPVFVMVVSALVISQHIYLPRRAKLVQEQLQTLKDTRHGLLAAVEQIQNLEEDLRQKSSQAATLQEELRSLRTLNADTASELGQKLKALELVNRQRIWFERAISFVIGVTASLVASYLWQTL